MIERERQAVWADDEMTRDNDDAARPVSQGEPVSTTVAEDEDARHERFMKIARQVMHDHRNVLAALAK